VWVRRLEDANPTPFAKSTICSASMANSSYAPSQPFVNQAIA
jgi:hypothetical protein